MANAGQKMCGGFYPLGLAPVRTIKNQHNYTASVSSFRVGNENQKDMISEMHPAFCFYKSNPL